MIKGFARDAAGRLSGLTNPAITNGRLFDGNMPRDIGDDHDDFPPPKVDANGAGPYGTPQSGCKGRKQDPWANMGWERIAGAWNSLMWANLPHGTEL